MAILNVRTVGDEALTKVCKPVKLITPRIEQLVDDMFETMYETGGVGLAAPQVGILKRIVVIDTTPEPENEEEEVDPEKLECYCMINPVILEQSGAQTGWEGCLSNPGMSGIVTRPDHVVCRFTDIEGNECEVEAEGLLARCICHELDHLDGHMYMEKVEGRVVTNEEAARIRGEEAQE